MKPIFKRIVSFAILAAAVGLSPLSLSSQTIEKWGDRDPWEFQETPKGLSRLNEGLIALMDVRPGLSVAGFGTGSGELAVPLARTVGLEGRVFVKALENDLIDDWKPLEDRDELPQLSILRDRNEDPLLPAKVDRIILNMSYHHLSRPGDFMARLLDYVKPGCLLAVSAVDVHIRKSPKGTPVDPSVSDPEETRAAIEDAGWVFQELKHPAASMENYILIFSAPAIKTERISPK